MITPDEIINERILATSWKQPYADMMLYGKIETRLWPTKYRGLVLICSSLHSYSDHELAEISGDGYLFKFVQLVNKDYSAKFLRGHAIAIGRLVNCRPMNLKDEARTLVKYKAPCTTTECRGKLRQYKIVERHIWCHEYEDVTPIKPFPWKGTQGWKELTEEDKLQIDII